MKTKLLPVLILFILFPYCDSKTPVEPTPVTSWDINEVGRIEWNTKGMVIGDGRNDGRNSLYIGSYGGSYITEFSYSGEWKSSVISMPDSSNGSFNGLAIGDGRNDGISRIYSANTQGAIYEFTYNGSGWDAVNIFPPSVHMFSVINVKVISARGDNINRIYANIKSGQILEFTYENNKWKQEYLDETYLTGGYTDIIFISKSSGSAPSIFSTRNNYGLNEYNYQDDSWDNFQIPGEGNFWGIAGSNSQFPIYLTGMNTLYELDYSAGSWQLSTVSSGISGGWGVKLAVGDGRNNGNTAAYTFGAPNENGLPLMEHSKSSGEWESKVISWFSYIGEAALIIGEARDDGVNRIYAVVQIHRYEPYYVYELTSD